MLKYSDPITGDLRYKRRVIWGIQGFIVGTLFGMALMVLL